MRKIKCIAIDDDPIFLELLKKYIEKTDFLELMGAFEDPDEGVSAVVTANPDLLFVDMYINHTTGMEIIQNLPRKPKIIMITSSPDFAVDAFAEDVTDYIVKPLDNYTRFLKAVDKVRNALPEQAQPKTEDGPIFFKVDSSLISMYPADILMVQAYGDYIKVIHKQRTYVVKNKIGGIEEHLPSYFVRIHRSYVVNLNHITNIEGNSVKIGGQMLPVGQLYKDDLMARIKSIS